LPFNGFNCKLGGAHLLKISTEGENRKRIEQEGTEETEKGKEKIGQRKKFACSSFFIFPPPFPLFPPVQILGFHFHESRYNQSADLDAPPRMALARDFRTHFSLGVAKTGR
jgi:hypothetical protein